MVEKTIARISAVATVLRKTGFGATSPGPVAGGPEAGPSRRSGGRAQRHRAETGTLARRRGRPLAAGLAAAALMPVVAALALPLAGLFTASAQAAKFEGEARPPVSPGDQIQFPQAHDGSTPFDVFVDYYILNGPGHDTTVTNATVTVQDLTINGGFFRLIVTPNSDAPVQINVPGIGTRTVQGPAGDARLKNIWFVDSNSLTRSLQTAGGNRFNPEIRQYRVNGATAVGIVPSNSNATIRVLGRYSNADGKFTLSSRSGGEKYLSVNFGNGDTNLDRVLTVRVTSANGQKTREYYLQFPGGPRSCYGELISPNVPEYFTELDTLTVTAIGGSVDSGPGQLAHYKRGYTVYVTNSTTDVRVSASGKHRKSSVSIWTGQRNKSLDQPAKLRHILWAAIKVRTDLDDRCYESWHSLKVVKLPLPGQGSSSGGHHNRAVGYPLTAQPVDLPAKHDGSTFTFRLLFSEDVDIEPEEMRDHALEVTGGTVTNAARVDGRSDLWELTVEPSGTAVVGIIVPQPSDCTEEGALCTSDGRPLSGTLLRRKVRYVESDAWSSRAPSNPSTLTAAFENAPASHDGSSTITVELAFSKAVFDGTESFDRNQRIGDAVAVTNGTVKGQQRADPREYDRWRLWIEPSGNGDVTLRLPATTGGCDASGAICTPDGEALSNAPQVTVQGPSTLTASFENAPASHDGSSTITVELAFSEAVFDGTESFDRNQRIGDAVAVTNGVVKGQQRVNPQEYDRWRLWIEPSGNGDVTLRLPVSTCDAANAICTPGGTALSGEATATIEGPGTAQVQQPATLTAAFENGPSSHDGSNAFTLELAFSEAVFEGTESFNMNARIRGAVSVTGGTMANFRRTDPAVFDRWTLRINPAGNADVTVSLPATTSCNASGAICTPGGTPLSGPTTATIQGPATLSVADATVEEGPDAELAFVITLSRAASQIVTVDFATSNDSATAGEDYTAKSETVTFPVGTVSKRVNVAVIDDAVNEGNETMIVTLSNASGAVIADGTATGTIENSDPMPRAWTIRFARAAGDQIVQGVGARLDGGGGNHVSVAGISLMGGALEDEEATRRLGFPGWETERALEPRTQDLSGQDLLLGTRFSLSTGTPSAGAPAFGAWGHVATASFDAEDEGVSHDGDVVTGMVGADIAWERALAGVVLSHSAGDGGFTGDGAIAGDIDVTMTGVYPYGRVDFTRSTSLWAIAGGGWGDVTIEPEGATTVRTDASMRMGAVGVKGRVLEPGEDGGLALNVRSDAMWVQTETDAAQGVIATEADATRLRLILEGERTVHLAEGESMTPSAEIGLRHDGGDAETGAGVEMGAGLRYSAGRLAIEGRVRGLVAHEDDGYKEWGASASVRLQPGEHGQGLSLSVAPVWGAAGSKAEQLWGARDARDLDPSQAFEADARLEAEMGYGLAMPHNRGLLTPYAAATLGDAGAHRIRTGARWNIAPNAAAGVEGLYAGEDRALNLRLRVSF